MFILIALGSALAATVLDYIFFITKKTPSEYIRVFFRNVFTISLVSLAVQKYVMNYKHFLDTSGYKAKNYIHFLIASLCVALVFELFFAFINRGLRFNECKPPKHKAGSMAFKIFAVVLFFLGCAAYFGTVWGKGAFGDVTGDQLIINLTSPTEGTESSVYTDGFEGPVFNTVLATTLFSVVLFAIVSVEYLKNGKAKVVFSELAKRIACFILAALCLYSGVSYGVKEYKLEQLYNAYVVKSDFIEDNYVDPATAKVTFPEKKRNLIHIYLESVEVSYLSKELGGNMKHNLMPNLTALAENGIVFSDSDLKFGGPAKGTGTQWSIASMVNQTSGIPMKAPGMHNAYGAEGNFLPGAYTLGEMLEKEGYVQTFMIGSSAKFGGLGYYYQNHGNWKIFDYNYALENHLLPTDDYEVWWGFEDDKLFDFAKEELTDMYKSGKPFNLTLETADTHRPGGYITPGKEKPYKDHYASAIWNSDKDVCEFVKWIMAQPFYENTTIVLIGDHISMETEFFEKHKFTKDYSRKQFNLILNPDPSVASPSNKVTKNRIWANWDMYPTIVTALGGKIEGERLGIGVNLFSGENTIYEGHDFLKINKELEKRSDLYNEKILGGTAKEAGRSRTNFGKSKAHKQS